MRWITSLGVFIIGAVVLTAFPERSVGFAQSGASLPVFGYTVVHSFPHDHDAFTQGLQFVDGVFYEGTGLEGRSSIRKVKIETGEVLKKRDVPPQYFGEGITVRGGELFQLTWQSNLGFVYDRNLDRLAEHLPPHRERLLIEPLRPFIILSCMANAAQVADTTAASSRAPGAPLVVSGTSTLSKTNGRSIAWCACRRPSHAGERQSSEYM